MYDGEWTTCWKCKTVYFLPRALSTAARANQHIEFCCPYGHKGHFADGPTDEEKLRQKRDRLVQRLAQKDDDIRRQRERREAAERSAAAYKGQATKLRKRAKRGVCPCCSRTFQNLAAHMKTKHPKFEAEEPLTVIEGGKAV